MERRIQQIFSSYDQTVVLDSISRVVGNKSWSAFRKDQIQAGKKRKKDDHCSLREEISAVFHILFETVGSDQPLCIRDVPIARFLHPEAVFSFFREAVEPLTVLPDCDIPPAGPATLRWSAFMDARGLKTGDHPAVSQSVAARAYKAGRLQSTVFGVRPTISALGMTPESFFPMSVYCGKDEAAFLGATLTATRIPSFLAHLNALQLTSHGHPCTMSCPILLDGGALLANLRLSASLNCCPYCGLCKEAYTQAHLSPPHRPGRKFLHGLPVLEWEDFPLAIMVFDFDQPGIPRIFNVVWGPCHACANTLSEFFSGVYRVLQCIDPSVAQVWGQQIKRRAPHWKPPTAANGYNTFKVKWRLCKDFFDLGMPSVSHLLKIRRLVVTQDGSTATVCNDVIGELSSKLWEMAMLWRGGGVRVTRPAESFQALGDRVHKLWVALMPALYPISVHVWLKEVGRMWRFYGQLAPLQISEEAGECSHQKARQGWKKNSTETVSNPRRTCTLGARNGFTDYLRQAALAWSYWMNTPMKVHWGGKTAAKLQEDVETLKARLNGTAVGP